MSDPTLCHVVATESGGVQPAFQNGVGTVQAFVVPGIPTMTRSERAGPIQAVPLAASVAVVQPTPLSQSFSAVQPKSINEGPLGQLFGATGVSSKARSSQPWSETGEEQRKQRTKRQQQIQQQVDSCMGLLYQQQQQNEGDSDKTPMDAEMSSTDSTASSASSSSITTSTPTSTRSRRVEETFGEQNFKFSGTARCEILEKVKFV